MKRLVTLLAALALLLSGCADGKPQDGQEDAIHILATTYPVYLLTTAVTEGVEGMEVSLLVNQQTSCLHDYTLTVRDMKAIESADIIVMNGAGLEDFMSDALAASSAAVIDCSAGLDLLPATGHHDHDHSHDEHHDHFDPHFWLDPAYAAGMLETIAAGLGRQLYGEDWADQGDFHTAFLAAAERLEGTRRQWDEELGTLAGGKLVTFHDGFQYLAHSRGLTILKAIEEEEGATASASDIKEVVTLIEEHHLPAVFVEVNGSDATAQAIARETGVAVYALDMLMSGDGVGIEGYIAAIDANYDTIIMALGG